MNGTKYEVSELNTCQKQAEPSITIIRRKLVKVKVSGIEPMVMETLNEAIFYLVLFIMNLNLQCGCVGGWEMKRCYHGSWELGRLSCYHFPCNCHSGLCCAGMSSQTRSQCRLRLRGLPNTSVFTIYVTTHN